MYARLFQPRTLEPSYPKPDSHSSIQVSSKLDFRERPYKDYKNYQELNNEIQSCVGLGLKALQ